MKITRRKTKETAFNYATNKWVTLTHHVVSVRAEEGEELSDFFTLRNYAKAVWNVPAGCYQRRINNRRVEFVWTVESK